MRKNVEIEKMVKSILSDLNDDFLSLCYFPNSTFKHSTIQSRLRHLQKLADNIYHEEKDENSKKIW